MKKRLFGTLMSLCLIVALFVCFSASAFAADDSWSYTLKGGDTVYNVCINNGIDFYKYQNWIIRNNGIASFNNLKVGQVLVLPGKNTDPNSTVTTAQHAAATAAVTVTKAATAFGLQSGDSVVGYWIPYVMKAGDTVATVCTSLGVDFGLNNAAIKTVNNIQSYNKMKVGQVVLLPSKTAPSSGNYTMIVAHKVAAGDTTGAICRNYGIDYASNVDRLKALNNTANLAVIKVGQTLYLPVPGTAGSATTAADPSLTIGNTDFKVDTLIVSNGGIEARVGGTKVLTARQNQTVQVVTTPLTGFKLQEIQVTKSGTPDRIAVNGDGTFVMPACDVVISATFQPA
ncbi:MAG: LysM peptidoglycan-binding domain-containing protein [Oscillospiraceae bacterium]|nr:LysM peptidoglycan-binding domain-containing protein [Oscillospiraceae bacterium]